MRVLYVGVYQRVAEEKEVQVSRLASAARLDGFEYLSRGEMMQIIVEQSAICIMGTREGEVELVRLTEEDSIPYFVYVKVRRNGLAALCVADEEYPASGAFGLLRAALRTYVERSAQVDTVQAGAGTSTMPAHSLLSADLDRKPKYLRELLDLHQELQGDSVLPRIQRDLFQLKGKLRVTLAMMAERALRLTVLEGKQRDISKAADEFVKKAASLNTCCARWRRSWGSWWPW
jgi:hypothetical protein